jgi:hypothetical protein
VNKSEATPTQMSVLATIGFGPDSPLMRQAKLFTDMRFLAALLVELEDELGPAGARAALFQIGLIQGMRDAYQVLDQTFVPGLAPTSPLPECPPLAIHLETHGSQGGVEIPGAWPECYEAEARLSKLGSSPDATCSLSAGYTSGWLSGTFDAQVLVIEHSCVSRGDSRCEFLALESEAWHGRDSAEARKLLADISFPAAREAALALLEPGPADPLTADSRPLDAGTLPPRSEAAPSQLQNSFAPLDPAVHIWGPVMILPCAELDHAARTIDMLGYDRSVSDVRVVVVDLRDAVLDEAFAAASLEQIVEYLEAWGAEVILTNVAPLSEKIVAGLETSHLLIRKDLPEAIAAAFQISEAQKHLL